MGFLQKLGLVESEKPGFDYDAFQKEVGSLEVAVSVPVSMDLTGLVTVADIYAKNELVIEGNTIFKVAEMRAALPASLPEKTKKESVVGLFPITGMKMEDLISDADARKVALESTLIAFSNETDEIIADGEDKIAQLEAAIEQVKKANSDRVALQEEQNKIVKEELKKIQDIVDFLG